MRKNQIVQRLIVGFIRFYQGWKWTGLVPAACRFVPSCSDYAIQAIDKHGLCQGFRLGVKRLFRCRPGVLGGMDPVT